MNQMTALRLPQDAPVMVPETEQNDRHGVAMRAGIGNWQAFNLTVFSAHHIRHAAKEWGAAISGVDLPWLCWNVDPDWCLVQQRLVESVGWTPVVGYDPRVGPPPLTSRAVLIDFNAPFGFGTMYPHFPLEFAFAWAPRLAFWHSDFLLRPDQMRHYADMFANLPNGEMAAVEQDVGWRNRLFRRKELRYWELLGCMTAGASQSNFATGCGWWLRFDLHENCPHPHERQARRKHHWECGVGIRYWAKRYGGKVHAIPERDVAAGHFTRIGNQQYVGGPSDWRRDLNADLARNFKLGEACRKMGLERVLEAV